MLATLPYPTTIEYTQHGTADLFLTLSAYNNNNVVNTDCIGDLLEKSFSKLSKKKGGKETIRGFDLFI